MAADVSRQIKNESSKSCLITRDFLGGCFGIDSKELDLDLHVPSGWEKRLDLKSGKVYIQRCNSTNSSSEQKINPTPQMLPKTQYDLIQASSNLKPTLDLLEDSNLDLKLVSNCSPSSYTSVCTLDKVKSALDRAERTSASSSSSSRKRWMIPSVRSPTSSMSNSSSISVKEGMDHEDGESLSVDRDNGGLVATACPGCLLYVLISKSDPKCPKCNSLVQMPSVTKKPRIDLNISM